MAVTTDSLDAAASLTGTRGQATDKAFKGVTVVAGAAVLGVLGLIAVTITTSAMPAFRSDGLHFITSTDWSPVRAVFGALTFVYGTAVVSAIAVIVAVPVSIGIALFLSELAPPRVRAAIVMVIDLLAAVPSVVYGLWGIAIVAPWIAPHYQTIADWLAPIPVLNTLFGEGATGRSFMTAGLILGLMITPIVTSLSREVLDTVPESDKSAALALGATRWEMIRGAVIPHSFGGLVGAVMLGLGRAMGETIAVALTIGSSIQVVGNLFKSGTALSEVIVLQWGESNGTHRAALVGLGVLLFAITIVINVAARWIITKAEVRMRGKAA